MNRSLHHLRTQSLLFPSLPQVAFHIYCPHLFNTAIYSLNVKTKDEEISDGLIHTAKCHLTAKPCILQGLTDRRFTHHTLETAAVGLEIKRLLFMKPL